MAASGYSRPATQRRKSIHVRSTPNTDRNFDALAAVVKCQQWSFDDLVRDHEQARRHDQTERLRSLEIEGRFVLGRRLHWKADRLGPAQDVVIASIDVLGEGASDVAAGPFCAGMRAAAVCEVRGRLGERPVRERTETVS